MMSFYLRFPVADIPKWFDGYDAGFDAQIINDIAPRIQAQHYLNKQDFLALCYWKTPRSKPRCERNDESYIQEVTQIALTTSNERLRFEVLHLLDGVQSPTASVILHYGYDNLYPIIDYRALWSLSVDKLPAYTFDFWWSYVTYCRKLAQEADVPMRTLDRALWLYSKENQ